MCRKWFYFYIIKAAYIQWSDTHRKSVLHRTPYGFTKKLVSEERDNAGDCIDETSILPTKMSAAQNEFKLSYHRVRGLYFGRLFLRRLK